MAETDTLERLTEDVGKGVGDNQPSTPMPSWMGDVTATPDTRAPFQSDPPRQSIEDMTRPPDAIVDLQRQRTGAMDDQRRQQFGIISQDQAETHRRFAQTGIEPGTLEPWDNNKQREKYRTDPLESFGSLGSVFAMVASAFTRAPMENALNGAAAAMNAIAQGNEKEFELAHRAWKENTDLALKRHDIMQQQYQNAIQLMSSDVTAGRAKMEMLAASFDDRQLSGLMEAGLWPQGLELMEKRIKVAEGLREVSLRNERDEYQRVAMAAAVKRNSEEPDLDKRALANLLDFNKIHGVKELGTVPQQLLAQFMRENPGATADQAADFARKNGALPYAYRGQGRETTPQLQAEEIKRRAAQYMASPEEGGEGLPPNEAFDRASKEVTSDFAKPTGANAVSPQDQDLITRLTEKYQAPPYNLDREAAELKARTEVSRSKAKGGGGAQQVAMSADDLASMGWTNKTIETAARTFNKTGKMPTNLGTRQFAGNIAGLIQQRASELLEEEGKSPEDRAQQWQKYGSQKTAITRFESGPQGNIIRSLNTVVDHLATLKDLGDALKNGKTRLFNEIAQRWAEETGKPAPTNFDTARRIVGAEIIKAIGVSGAGTKDERKDAADGFTRARSSSQIDGAIGVAQRLMAGQLSSLRLQFKVATRLPETEFDEMLDPRTQEFFKTRLGGAAPPKKTDPAGKSLGGARSGVSTEGPPVGTEDNGYRFKGGANIQENWEKM